MSAGWQERYADKLASPAQAIRRIQPGMHIFVGSGAAEPACLVEAMVRDGDHLADNEVLHILTLGPAPYVAPGLSNRFRHTAFFIGPNVREAVQSGRADFMPVFLSEIPPLIRSRRVKVDVALIQVSPPDERGLRQLGRIGRRRASRVGGGKSGDRPGELQHAAHVRRVAGPGFEDRLPGADGRAAVRAARRAPRRDHRGNWPARRQSHPRRSDVADRHRPHSPTRS